MPRLTRREKDQTIRSFYGIDPKTFEVRCVSLTRGGVLRMYSDYGSYDHPIHPSNINSPEREIGIVWHLTNIKTAYPGITDIEQQKKIVSDLEEIAEAMKAKFKG